MNPTNISDSGAYVAEKFSNGFSLFLGAPGSELAFARECIKLGHRIASEGEDIEDISVIRDVSMARYQPQITVRVKFKTRSNNPHP